MIDGAVPSRVRRITVAQHPFFCAEASGSNVRNMWEKHHGSKATPYEKSIVEKTVGPGFVHID